MPDRGRPDYGPYAEGRWPSDLLNAHQLAAVSHDWGIEGGWPSWRARVLGGCSAHNGCFVVWGPPVDYDEWAQAAILDGRTTVKNDGSCSLLPETATRTMARAMPPSV